MAELAVAAAEDWDIRRVFMTQMGLVQIVEEAPAVIAESICVTHFLSISALSEREEPKRAN